MTDNNHHRYNDSTDSDRESPYPNEAIHVPKFDRECPVCRAPFQDISGGPLSNIDEIELDMRNVVKTCIARDPGSTSERAAAEPGEFWLYHHSRGDMMSTIGDHTHPPHPSGWGRHQHPEDLPDE